MYEALMEIMEPKIKLREDMLRREIQEEAQKKVQEVQKDSIRRTINTLRDFGHKNPEIKSAIIKTYKLSESEAEEYL